MGFTILDYLVMAVATWRVSAIITEEHGPFGVFKWIRHETLRRLASNGKCDITLVACIKCASVWVALLVLLAYSFFPEVVWCFSISGMALFLRSYTGVSHD